MRILVITAHPDDLVYGAAGMLASHATAEKRIFSLCEIKRPQAESVAKELGADITFFGATYWKIEQELDRLRAPLTAAISDWLPDYIFAPPSTGDWSPDHRSAGSLAFSAAMEAGAFGQWRARFLRFPIPASTMDFQPNVWLALPYELLDLKIELGRRMTEGEEGMWPREIVEWEVGTQMRFAQQCGWPVRHAEAFDAVQAVPFTELPPRNASMAANRERQLDMVRRFRTTADS